MTSDPSPPYAAAAPPRVPRWVTALDVLALVLVALTLRSLLSDGYHIVLSPAVRLSLSSSLRLAIWLAVLLAVRHLAWRGLPWHVRAGRWARAFWNNEAFAAAWPVFLLSRICVLVVGYIAVWTIGFPGVHQRYLENDLLDLYARYDAGWYFHIASLGYPTQFSPSAQNPIAFFPGLPLAMRAVAALADVNMWVAGIIAVTIAFPWGLTYVYRLAREELAPDQARAALMLLAFYPFAVCYSVLLTESLFLLTAAGAFFHFRRGQLLKAAAFGLATGLLRPNGFMLCVPLGLLALLPLLRQRAGVRWPLLIAQLATAAAPVLGMLAYAAHVNQLTGDPFAWMKAQEAWGRSVTGGLDVWEEHSRLIETRGVAEWLRSYPIELFEIAAGFFALIAVVPIIRRFGLAYGAFVAMSVVPPMLTMGSVSVGRYTAPLFPIFLWLGASIAPERRQYWIAAFACGEALVAVMFYTSRPPY